jgi:Fe-S-cluster containining protein
MPIIQWIEADPVQRHYLDVRATLIEGTYVVKAPCKYLIKSVIWGSGGSAFENKCGVEDNKPELCRMYKGKSTQGKRKFWIPPGCTMAGEK